VLPKLPACELNTRDTGEVSDENMTAFVNRHLLTFVYYILRACYLGKENSMLSVSH